MIEPILAEVGEASIAYQLDASLQNAWAELRTADQLCKEGFRNIEKVTAIADFIATKDRQKYAFQVTRTQRTLRDQIKKLNAQAKWSGDELRNGTQFGELDTILFNLEEPLSEIFQGSIDAKNTRFRDWSLPGFRRCIVLVTSDEKLNEYPFLLHTACRMIGKQIQSLSDQGNLFFDELIWLPDISNGAWFSTYPVDCFCDWQNELLSYPRDYEIVERKRIDLDCLAP